MTPPDSRTTSGEERSYSGDDRTAETEAEGALKYVQWNFDFVTAERLKITKRRRRTIVDAPKSPKRGSIAHFTTVGLRRAFDRVRRLFDPSTILRSESIRSEPARVRPDPIYNATTDGIVIAHKSDAFIVQFDVDGVLEERAFFWDDVKLSREELPVGTKVQGWTELLFALPAYDEPAEVHARIVRELRSEHDSQGAKTCEYRGRSVSAEEQAASDLLWAARTGHKPSPQKPRGK